MKKPVTAVKGHSSGPAEMIATRFLASLVGPLLEGRNPEVEQFATQIVKARAHLIAIIEAEWDKALVEHNRRMRRLA